MNLSFQSKVESRRLSSARAGSSFNQCTALTLLEMMVAVTLLAVIMVGLLAMFQYAQRALHVAHTQTDVFENARGAIQLVARDLSEMTGYGDAKVINAYAVPVASPIPTGKLSLTTTNLPVFFSETFWLTRVNDEWQGIGYYVEGTNFGVGTLYRFSHTTNYAAVPALRSMFFDPTIPTHRVSDGIVHFQLTAGYLETDNKPGKSNFVSSSAFSFPYPFIGGSTNSIFLSNSLPAFIDIELGVLEPATLKQFNSLTSDVVVARNFLRDHVGRIHFFRERVPIHNFINPYRANDLQ
ncbi:MAG TPA: hypothetical protein VGF13_10160 [Verrucomicrobiae bacterium]|jgi:type II secretory pathway pseudopilin PulG